MSERSPAALGLYALAAILALFELAVFWQALHPNVPENYHAYYLDKSTTCLTQPVTGVYTLGTELDFTAGGDDTRELRPCGWDGPAGDGAHSIGTSSRLKFAIAEPQDLTLTLDLSAVTMPGPPEQRVVVSAGGTELQTLTVLPDQVDRFMLPIPASAIDDLGFLEIIFDYPDAINPNGRTSNTHWRAIKLSAASLSPAAI
ncbi:MAG: hypothetical protein P0Y65_00835 [Candidatus Devosia phytovorans]|uniref:Uncharacterized protein n=1 Tax=Candidatus Devosia phytovorans TaxID=3121372 RepID=A0AAJ6AZQ6_9HYPH|nr:hypothetical protein [Devosia sp.]WEK04835.1 MAG: hypothetical protein P0Y65_00835 [Devosia sp.]